jgi:signal peptidase I
VKRTRLWSVFATALFIMFVAIAWWYFAPTRIGGSTSYVVTHGTSMEPRFYTGDLAIIRSAASYQVGEIVAYRSDLLHTTVLHRIIARQGTLFVFRGDHNDFIDPQLVPRADLVGKLWLRVPHGGVLLSMLHTPMGAAALCALVGVLTLLGVTEKGRRRRRRRNGPARSGLPGIPIVNNPRDHRPVKFGALLTASAVASAVFVVLGLIAFSRPARRAVPTSTPYSQKVSFGYSAHVHPGLIYPGGSVTTGDPIFLTLVRGLGISIDYKLTGDALSQVTGTESVLFELTGPSGWTRSLTLVPPTRFTGTHTSTDVPLDIPHVQSLLAKIATLTGGGSFVSNTVAVVPRIHIKATVAGHPVNTTFAPALNFEVTPTQLLSSGASAIATSPVATGEASVSGSKAGYSQTKGGIVMGVPVSAPATFTVLGISPAVSLLRWIALIGLLLSIPTAVYAFLRRRAEPFQETVHIQSQYGHMIVPILAGEDLGWPAVDVPNIKALVKLAESAQRLILHSRAPDVDTYMVNDEGTVYRYQVRPSKVVWGQWSDTPAPVKAAA